MRSALVRGLGAAAVLLTTVGVTNLFWPQIVAFVDPVEAVDSGEAIAAPGEAPSIGDTTRAVEGPELAAPEFSIDQLSLAEPGSGDADPSESAPSEPPPTDAAVGPALGNPSVAEPVESAWSDAWSPLAAEPVEPADAADGSPADEVAKPPVDDSGEADSLAEEMTSPEGESATATPSADDEQATWDALFTSGKVAAVAYRPRGDSDASASLFLSATGEVLAEGPGIDPYQSKLTPIRFDGRWWLFRDLGGRSSDVVGLISGQNGVDLATGESSRRGPGWVEPSLTWRAEVRDGDLWLGRFEPMAKRKDAMRRVTRVGRFDDFRLTAWAGASMYFDNPANPDRRIVRVNLRTNETTELPWPRVTNRQGAPSPDGRLFARIAGDLLVVDDLVRSERSYTTNLLAYDHPLRVRPAAQPTSRIAIRDNGFSRDTSQKATALWIDSRRVAFAAPWLDSVGVLDVRKTTVELISLTSQRPGYAHHLAPNRREAFSLATRRDGSLLIARGDNVGLLSLASGSTQPLRSTGGWYTLSRSWVTPDVYVYERAKGALDEIGVWVHDLKTDQQRRVWRFGRSTLAGFDRVASQAYFLDRDARVFRVPIDGGEPVLCDHLAGVTRVATLAAPRRIDEQTALRRLATADEVERVLPTPDAQQASPIAKELLSRETMIRAGSARTQAVLRQVQGELPKYPFYDPRALLAEAKRRIESGEAKINEREPAYNAASRLLQKLDFQPAYRRDRLMAWAFDWAAVKASGVGVVGRRDDDRDRLRAGMADRQTRRVAARTAQLFAQAYESETRKLGSGYAQANRYDRRLDEALEQAQAELGRAGS